jgi:hypothetical protein
MTKVHYLAGYRIMSALAKDEIKEILGKYKNEIVKVRGRLN